MKSYITHILAEKLPASGFKQISFLTSDESHYHQSIFFYGYHGSRRITEDEIAEEMREDRILRLANPLISEAEKYLWLDSKGNLWSSDDILMIDGKRMEGPTILGHHTLPKNELSPQEIFQQQIRPVIGKIHFGFQIG